MFPMAYATRGQATDPRSAAPPSFFVRQRAQLIAHIQNTNSQFNHPPFPKKLSYAGNRTADIAERFDDPSTRLSIDADLGLIAGYDEQIAMLERHLVRNAKVDDPLPSACCGPYPASADPGLVLLYEIDQIGRFPKSQLSLLQPAGPLRPRECRQDQGLRGKKIGNAHLKWAFSERLA